MRASYLIPRLCEYRCHYHNLSTTAIVTVLCCWEFVYLPFKCIFLGLQFGAAAWRSTCCAIRRGEYCTVITYIDHLKHAIGSKTCDDTLHLIFAWFLVHMAVWNTNDTKRVSKQTQTSITSLIIEITRIILKQLKSKYSVEFKSNLSADVKAVVCQ